nr:immunoglobulin light chain junction region [Macaca mulatta]MOV86322.1 immunoglobulin light chain junction region [Macaca mulatta]MOW39096.1 immunoglobulin light chain junction region [Macaca mulatta]MOX47747.1 immunoglobulin light chain junction region [Macaca mulatta]MOX47867.1 immunoglobulin light chain junction region [Macaca mulatta]
CQQHNGYPRTF